MAPIPIVLDVDTGVDDALALLFAVRHPDLELRAVTCVAGNGPVDQVVRNTLYVLDAAGADDVPVARGSVRPLLTGPAPFDSWHGSDGLAGFSRPSDRRRSPLSAVELLRRSLMSAISVGETITVIPLAPLTNIALLLRAYPEVAAGIERIVFMGGSASVGNMTPVAEFNVWHDPEAAAVTLAAADDLDVPVTMYGLDVFDAPLLTAAEIHGRRQAGDPGAELAAMMVAEMCRLHDLGASTIGDAGAVCAVADPAGLVTRRFGVRVDSGSGIGRGQTVVDRRDPTEPHEWNPMHRAATEVDVALEVDAGRYVALWLDTVCGPVSEGGDG